MDDQGRGAQRLSSKAEPLARSGIWDVHPLWYEHLPSIQLSRL